MAGNLNVEYSGYALTAFSFSQKMQEQHALPYLKEVLLFLSLAGIFVPLLQRVRVNQVLGFLAVGALAGPFGLGLLVDQYLLA